MAPHQQQHSKNQLNKALPLRVSVISFKPINNIKDYYKLTKLRNIQ